MHLWDLILDQKPRRLEGYNDKIQKPEKEVSAESKNLQEK